MEKLARFSKNYVQMRVSNLTGLAHNIFLLEMKREFLLLSLKLLSNLITMSLSPCTTKLLLMVLTLLKLKTERSKEKVDR
jgi:hypothetical protein